MKLGKNPIKLQKIESGIRSRMYRQKLFNMGEHY